MAGERSPMTASPGLGGAIRDAVGAVIKTVAPRQFRQHKQKVDAAIEGNSSDQSSNAGQQAQSSDASNGY